MDYIGALQTMKLKNFSEEGTFDIPLTKNQLNYLLGWMPSWNTLRETKCEPYIILRNKLERALTIPIMVYTNIRQHYEMIFKDQSEDGWVLISKIRESVIFHLERDYLMILSDSDFDSLLQFHVKEYGTIVIKGDKLKIVEKKKDVKK